MLFVDVIAPFSEVAEELLETLRAVYPDGLSRTQPSYPPASPEEKTPLPENASQIVFGVLKNVHDTSSGWKALKIGKNDTATTLGVKDNAVVAFTFLDDEDTRPNLASVDFPVVFPYFADEVEEE